MSAVTGLYSKTTHINTFPIMHAQHDCKAIQRDTDKNEPAAQKKARCRALQLVMLLQC